MNQLLAYGRNDLKLIFRDPVLWALLFVPLLIIALLRYGIPPMIGALPVLEAYTPLILAVFCLTTALFPAYIISFVILDERDQDVLTVIRILPVSFSRFLHYRLMFITLLSFVNCLLTVSLTGLIDWGIFRMILVSLQGCLVAPLTTLWITAFARNKIEGATWVKGLNFAYNLPVIAYLFEGKWEYLMGWIPSYWVFKTFDPGYSGMDIRLIYPAGFVLIGGLLLTGWRVFQKRVFA